MVTMEPGHPGQEDPWSIEAVDGLFYRNVDTCTAFEVMESRKLGTMVPRSHIFAVDWESMRTETQEP
jgi:hypothetical protein